MAHHPTWLGAILAITKAARGSATRIDSAGNPPDADRKLIASQEADDMHKVVHFEIPADDLDRAKNFYGSIFGWQLQSMPMAGGEYTVVMTTPVDEQTQLPTEPCAINGGMMQRDARTP